MANFEQLKATVANVIKTNGEENITGAIMQDVLLTIINSIAGGYMFGGVARHSGNVGNPDYNVFYLAGSGAYTGYGGAITIPDGCYGVFLYDGTWSQEVVDIGVHLTGDVATGEQDGVTGGRIKQALDDLEDNINMAINNLASGIRQTFESLLVSDVTAVADKLVKITEGIRITAGGQIVNISTFDILAATAEKAGLMSAADKQMLDGLFDKIRTLSISDTTPQGEEGVKIVESLSATLGDTAEVISTFTILAATASKAGLMSAADKTALDTLPSLINAGYLYAGIATPSTVPSSTSAKIFYIAIDGGTYTSFGNLNVTQGINIIYKSGDAWSVAQVVGIDNEPTAGSDNLVKSGGVQKIDERLGRIYTFTGATYKRNSVSLESGKLWYFNKFTRSWGSTDSITQTYQFDDRGGVQFLLYNVVSNSLSYASNSDLITSNDVILLQFNPTKGEFEGGELYADYINSHIGNVENSTLIYSLTNAEYYEDHVTINGGKLWWVDLETSTWKSTNVITQNYDFPTGVTSFFVLDKEDNTLAIRSNINSIKQTDVILLQHTVDGINGGILYSDYIKTLIKDNTERISVIEDKFECNVLKLATTVVGGVNNVDGIYNNRYGSILLIPVTKGQSIILTTQTDKPMVYALLADNVLVDGQRVNYAPGYDRNIITESNATVVVDITDGANYLYCLNVASNTVNYAPSSAIIKGVAMYGEKVHLSEEYKKIFRDNIGVDNSVVSVINTSVILRQGGYDNNLTFINDDEYRVSTNPIRDGKLFETYDDYRIEKAILLDSDLNVVDSINNKYLSENTSFAFPSVTDRKSWGTDNLLEGYYIVVSFVKADGGKISPNDTIIKNVYDIHSDDLTPVITDVPQLENAIKRSKQVQNLVFKTKAALPVITDYSTASYKDIPADKTCVGMMYCSSKEYDKYVPTHVSYKTFMSALHNRRSLIYTEIIGGSHTRSAYGIPYHGVSCVSYYGINCNYNVFNVLGIIIPENTAEVPSIDGMQLIYDSASGSEFDIQNLRPLDIIDRSGHICIISNVYKNRYGKNVVVAFSEANVTWARTSLYTEETFLARLHNGDYDHPVTNAYQIYRYSFQNNRAWENVYNRIASIKASYEEYLQDGVYNDDICTFAGDDAKFIEGDIIYLNINRGNYTQCQIYKDDALLQTINLSNDAEIDLNLTPYNLTDGSYKARLTDGVNYSDYTYWEVYQLNLSINNSKVASFSSARLTPLYFEFQGIDGSFDYSIGRKLISDAERESGEKTFTAAFNPSLYLKLFARTQDGYLITKRITYNV